jgi:hypothetical protein
VHREAISAKIRLTAQRRDAGGVGALVDVHLAVLVVTEHLDVHCTDITSQATVSDNAISSLFWNEVCVRIMRAAPSTHCSPWPFEYGGTSMPTLIS